jgi:predicted DNA-binding protein (UPF0251 family)
MSTAIVMGFLSATVDFREFNRVLTQYASNSKLTVEQAVAKKFRSVVFEARKLQLATRPDTLAEISRAKASGNLKISKRTMARVMKRRSKLAQQVERMKMAVAKGGKRGQKAALKMMSATTQLQRNASQEAWSAEVKQRENAAGRAGAWGWRIRGKQFQDIVSAHRSAKVSKSSDLFRTFLEITNNRPDSAQFAERKGIVSRAMANVLADMKTYVERQLSKL